MKTMKHFCMLFMLSLLASSCNFVDHIKQKAHHVRQKANYINKYDRIALILAKENRELKAEVYKLRFEINSLKVKNDHLASTLKGSKNLTGQQFSKRSIASIPVENDLVKFELYNWNADQMFAMAQDAFKKKNYEKAAQFFHSISSKFPEDSRIDDLFLFQAGIASFESNNHLDWSMNFLRKIVKNYPRSEFYKGAEMWIGLIYFQKGDKNKFSQIVKDFRRKYKKTSELKLLEQHYEKYISQKI